MMKLISKSVMSQPAQQTITIHILPKISKSKDNLAMELGQLIECNKRKEVEAIDLQLHFNIF